MVIQMSSVKISLIIAGLSVAYDQVYHSFLGLNHNIFTLQPTVAETFYYIFLKFVIVFIVAFLFVTFIEKKIDKQPVRYSVVVALISAGVFGFVLTYMFPVSYNQFIHVFHAAAIFVAAIMVWKFKIYY